MIEGLLYGLRMCITGAFMAFMAAAIITQVESNHFQLLIWEGVGCGLAMIIVAYFHTKEELDKKV